MSHHRCRWGEDESWEADALSSHWLANFTMLLANSNMLSGPFHHAVWPESRLHQGCNQGNDESSGAVRRGRVTRKVVDLPSLIPPCLWRHSVSLSAPLSCLSCWREEGITLRVYSSASFFSTLAVCHLWTSWHELPGSCSLPDSFVS